MVSSGKAIDLGLDFLLGKHNLMWSGHGAAKLIFYLLEDGKEVMQDKARSHVFRHPPPNKIKKEQSNIGQRTDFKNSVGYMIPTRYVGVSFYIKEVS